MANESLRWLPPKAFGLYVIELTNATMGLQLTPKNVMCPVVASASNSNSHC